MGVSHASALVSAGISARLAHAKAVTAQRYVAAVGVCVNPYPFRLWHTNWFINEALLNLFVPNFVPNSNRHASGPL
jgi:hypothetical protein